MTYFIAGLVLYLSWTICGIWFFLSVMGRKFRKQKWYDIILLLPVIPILFVIGWMNRK